MITINNKLNDEQILIISELEKNLFYPNSYSCDEIKKMSKHFLWIIKEVDNQIVGYAIVHDCFDYLEIYKIGVDKKFQNLGFGTQILEFVKDMKKSILIEVNSNDKMAINFYLKNDFKQYGVRKKYYCDGSDAILMKF